MSKHKAILAPIAALAFLLVAQTPSHAEIIKLKADLTGSEETPPSASKGSGTLKGLYDTTTKKLSWTITYSGLTGPVIRADFHGPAGAGEYGSIKVGVDAPNGKANQSPIEGSANLTERTEKPLDEALLSGNFYVNLHTTAHPNGEIRGQILTEK
jgi:CHRD domain